MKRAIIGGFTALIGSVWTLAVFISANSYNLEGWTTPPGKFLTQISESGLMLYFIISVALVVLGFVLMAVEYFKENS